MQLSLYQEAINFFGAMHTGYQCFFNIGSTAWAGGKGDEGRNITGVFFFNALQGIFYIIQQLVCVSNTYVNRSIHTNRAAALLCGTHNNSAGTGHQKFATGNGCIATFQVNGVAEC